LGRLLNLDSDGLLEYCLINLRKDWEMAFSQETTTFLLKTEEPILIGLIKFKLEISQKLKKVTKFDLFDFNCF